MPSKRQKLEEIVAKLRQVDVTKEWKMPTREWTEAKSQFAILFEERFKIA
jgi:transposase-like protein